MAHRQYINREGERARNELNEMSTADTTGNPTTDAVVNATTGVSKHPAAIISTGKARPGYILYFQAHRALCPLFVPISAVIATKDMSSHHDYLERYSKCGRCACGCSLAFEVFFLDCGAWASRIPIPLYKVVVYCATYPRRGGGPVLSIFSSASLYRDRT